MYFPLFIASTVLFYGALARCDSAVPFTLQITYDATNFFDKFDFRDAAYYYPQYPSGDPTDGSVNYLSKSDAISSGIASTENSQVYLGVDFTRKAELRGNSTTIHGRDSVRLESKDTWSDGLIIADIAHMPGTACSVWPSLWFYNFEENPVGEVDLVEGINVQSQNVVSLHTCGTCSFDNLGERSNCNNGGTESDSCEDGTNYDGCGNTMSSGSYGPDFNAGGGGVYAVWLESDALRLYWWSRKDIPADITDGTPDPNQWGTPASLFQSGKGCDVSRYFKDLTIIVNTDFCGDNINQDIWEGDCQGSTGVRTCDEYVTENPAAFKESYWLINSVKIYN
ncbi:MAG: hypothetical protein M1820_008452 [Bogoriella megaspora]|nr:MAG: hypothetical protein M1820_008452 [Bogoriella megaspora]